MKISEINQNLIGKKVKCTVTGLEVDGVIVGLYEDEHSMGVTIEHEPVQWGEYTYTKLTSTARKGDEFGNLQYVKLIDETNKN